MRKTYANLQWSYLDPSCKIDINITSNNNDIITSKRDILKSIVKCIEFCSRWGIALQRAQRCDKFPSENQGNFKELIKFTIEAGGSVLVEHLEKCSSYAAYTSKTSQNELLYCIKISIQKHRWNQDQHFGPYYGYQCDEVTDTRNWEQVGLVVRYQKNGAPVCHSLFYVHNWFP